MGIWIIKVSCHHPITLLGRTHCLLRLLHVACGANGVLGGHSTPYNRPTTATRDIPIPCPPCNVSIEEGQPTRRRRRRRRTRIPCHHPIVPRRRRRRLPPLHPWSLSSKHHQTLCPWERLEHFVCAFIQTVLFPSCFRIDREIEKKTVLPSNDIRWNYRRNNDSNTL